jgi:3-isopropylmalate/(R)-2-methylmalate dehydratase small subunit
MLAYYQFRLALNLLIFQSYRDKSRTELEVNLPEQTITLKATGEKESFDISGYKKI